MIFLVVDVYFSNCNKTHFLFFRLTGRSLFGGQTFDEVLSSNKKCDYDLNLWSISDEKASVILKIKLKVLGSIIKNA